MNACEWSQRVVVFYPLLKWLQCQRLPLSQNRKWLDDSVPQDFEKFRGMFFQELENVARELAIMRTLFDDDEIVDLAESLPDFGELRRQQLSKHRADAHASKIVAGFSNRAAPGGIVTLARMEQRAVDELRDANG